MHSSLSKSLKIFFSQLHGTHYVQRMSLYYVPLVLYMGHFAYFGQWLMICPLSCTFACSDDCDVGSTRFTY